MPLHCSIPSYPSAPIISNCIAVFFLGSWGGEPRSQALSLQARNFHIYALVLHAKRDEEGEPVLNRALPIHGLQIKHVQRSRMHVVRVGGLIADYEQK